MYKGVDPDAVNYLTSSIGTIYKNYGYDPLQKTLALACTILACSQFLVGKEDWLFRTLNKIFSFVM
jgi:hypothetical protein